MIYTFRNKALADLWSIGRSRIDKRLHKRILIRLETIDAAAGTQDLDLPGYNFHALRGFDPIRYTIHVNGPWCLTFEFLDGGAYHLDFEQYH